MLDLIAQYDAKLAVSLRGFTGLKEFPHANRTSPITFTNLYVKY